MIAAIQFLSGEPTKPEGIRETFLDDKVLLSDDVSNVMEPTNGKASTWPMATKRP